LRYLLLIAALVIGACGGSAEPGANAVDATTSTTPATPSTTPAATTAVPPDTADAGRTVEERTHTSDDGILTIVVPDGAGADDVTITAAEQADLPAELAALTAPVYAYELSPDGAEFSEPVQVTYRIPVADLPPMPDGGVPWILLVSATTDEELELYEDIEISREGDEVLVTGTTMHFSNTVAVVDNVEIWLESNPDPVSVPVGASFGVRVDSSKDLSTLVDEIPRDSLGVNYFNLVYGSKTPVTFVREVGETGGLYRCTSVSTGFVPDVFTVGVQLNNTLDRTGDTFGAFFGSIELKDLFLRVLGVAENAFVVARLSGDAECRDLAPGETIPADVPPSLLEAGPTSVMRLLDGGTEGATFDVEFPGDAQGIFEGGAVHRAIIDVNVSEGPVNVRLSYSVVDGVAETDGLYSDLGSAASTDDGTGSVSASTPADVTAEWTAENQLRITITGVEVPTESSVQVRVGLTETPGSHVHALVLNPT
jgi:hypothetical protein